MKKQRDMILEDEPPMSESVPYPTGEEQKTITNRSRKNEATGPKQKWCLAVDFSGGESKVQCCKEQYCMGIWNVRSMNQGKLDVVKQMASMNINILGNQWTKLQYFSHLIQRADSLEKTLMLRDWQQKEKRAAEDEMVR